MRLAVVVVEWTANSQTSVTTASPCRPPYRTLARPPISLSSLLRRHPRPGIVLVVIIMITVAPYRPCGTLTFQKDHRCGW
ncbi:hypothetical protein GALMADRAFT_255253 [Galerina marginata CBS 339.88]|uniref:Uncharacterized protein n=1 Tax=Galerina marginata (strain CBS 339.88) TaxID=685588 RepID=A0A067SGA8_GALM3|nr:hypothetical protein GALMADRAFT_255253 [Galerina marginata CBS 339.88]